MLMNITLAMLRTYVAVAESGSLMQASQRLARTPSAVSMSLKQLETEIGAPLFEGERKSTLTPTGRFALEQARNLVGHCDDGIAAMQAFARNEIGYVSIACVPSVAERILPQVIRDFHGHWPDVEIDIRDADSRSVINAVHSGRVQFGIASPVKDLPDLSFSPMFEDRLGVVCRADDPLLETVEGLCADSLLARRKLLVNSIAQSLTFPDSAQQPQESGITVHNVTSVLALVKAGMGITLLPRLSVPATDRQLAFLPMNDTGMRRSVGLFQRKDSTPAPATAAMINGIFAALADNANIEGKAVY